QNKIMVIGNLADPITPFISAKAVADGLGDSAVLLKHNGYGHTSLYMHSNCTVAATSKYFTTGELPSTGTVCESLLCSNAIMDISDISVVLHALGRSIILSRRKLAVS
ncbi:hypothetical protein RSAG8_13860, partial [Rhizoctonia solani AG-8 WAC10335]